MSSPQGSTSTDERITRWLRCPTSHGKLAVLNGAISCTGSEFHGSIRDDVAVMLTDFPESFFDDKFHVMKHGGDKKGEWDFCYAKQTELLTESLKPSMLVLDVGCGPVLPYSRPEGVEIIGLEPSFHSIRENHQVDLRVFGTAYSVPMADSSVDTVVCFYAIHHMVGDSVDSNLSNVGRAFSEFGRVIKPGGSLLVFEMTPMALFSISQSLFWNIAKRILGKRLDMHFFTASQLREIGSKSLPVGAQLEMVDFEAPWLTMFAPIFSIPNFKIPRILYPLKPRLYKWRMAHV